LALRADGTFWTLGTDGTTFYIRNARHSNTADFAIAQDGTLYKLNSSGNLDSVTPGGAWKQVGPTTMVKFALGADGTVWSLGKDGTLYYNGNPGYGNTADFAIARDGTLYKL